jgi:predicted RNA binding protein YcfA (HicA-like mRNA interferase family)
MPLSGKEMVKLFEECGWIFIRQNGSHVTMGKNGEREVIPMHKELGKGMEFKLLTRVGKNKK